MSRVPTQTDENEYSGENKPGRRTGPPANTYLNYPGQGGALLPGVLQHMHDNIAMVPRQAKPSEIEKGRAADMKYIRNALAKLGRATGNVCRPLTVRMLIRLDRLLTAPTDRNDPSRR